MLILRKEEAIKIYDQLCALVSRALKNLGKKTLRFPYNFYYHFGVFSFKNTTYIWPKKSIF